MDTTTLLNTAALLIPVLPLLTMVFIAASLVFGVLLAEKVIARMTSAVMAMVLGLSLVTAVRTWLAPGHVIHIDAGTWFSIGDYRFSLTFLMDRLSGSMMILTSIFLGLTGRFSVNYLHRETGFRRFFLLLHLFAAGMLSLLMAGSYEVLFMGWELVGLASVLLIGYFQERDAPVRNSLRVFAVYRVCDVGLLLTLFLMHQVAHSADFYEVFEQGGESLMRHATDWQATLLGIALLIAASGKSAQFPFGAWLPRAMEGPTPSSALFYGALSIHAGAFLLIRSAPVLELSSIASGLVVAVGVMTTLHGWLTGHVQTDVKGSLAYATMTFVGLIFIVIGLGFYTLASFLVVAHALLRGFQLLRAPSALLDAQSAQNIPAGSTLPGWLYRLSLERFYLDALYDRVIAEPLMAAGKALDRVEHGISRLLAGPELPQTVVTEPLYYPAVSEDHGSVPFTGVRFRAFGIAAAVAVSAAMTAWMISLEFGNELGLAVSARTHFPWLPAMILTPMVGGMISAVAAHRESARRIATGFSVWTLVLAVGALTNFQPGAGLQFVEYLPGISTPLLGFRIGVDGLSLPFMVLTTLLVAAALVAGPRQRLSMPAMAWMLMVEGWTLAALAAQDGGLLALTWTMTFVSTGYVLWYSVNPSVRRPVMRIWSLHAVLGAGALVVLMALLLASGGTAGAGVTALDLGKLTHVTLPAAWQVPAVVALLIAVMARSGIMPLHTSEAVLIRYAPTSLLVVLLTLPMGAYLLARFGIVLSHEHAPFVMSLVTSIALFQVVYGALVALVQRDLGRMIAYIGLSQSGLVMLGISEMRELSLEGAIFMSIGLSVTLSGLLILITSLKQRTGTTDMARFGGLVRQIPKLSTWFLLFGIATFGLPGSVAFVAGDLVMHDTFNIHPAMAVVVLAGTVLNSVTLVRAWSLTFLGNDNHALSIARQVHLADLIPREQYVVLGLAAIALVGGLMPGRVLRVEQEFVEQTLQDSGLDPTEPAEHSPSTHPASGDDHDVRPAGTSPAGTVAH
ncbi:MAG: hypothetical protein KGO50_02860 [Myxococcales bacterium]|nr:hypothetical protein [Myxococcales bacterium]